MKLALALTIIASFAGTPAFAADDCSYCARLEKLRAEFTKVKPDPDNRETAEKQGQLVDEAIDIGELILKNKSLKQDDYERLVTLLAEMSPYDNANTAAEVLLPLVKPHREKIHREAKRLQARGRLKPSEARVLEENFAIADKVLKHGTDLSIDQIESAEQKKKTK